MPRMYQAWGHFMARTHFVDLRSRTFWGLFEGLNGIFWVKNLISNFMLHDMILQYDTFPTVQRLPQSKSVCKSYASRKLTYPFDHHGTKWIPC